MGQLFGWVSGQQPSSILLVALLWLTETVAELCESG